jgi:type 1 glutamine amidotransferase
MSSRPKIIIHVAGHDFHPVYEQAAALSEWLSPDCWCHRAESLAAFEHLGECDLLIMLGMYFTGWEGRYRTPGAKHKRALEQHVITGNPVILCHGSIVSYDDWPRFGQLVGFSWPAGVRSFAPAADYAFSVSATHPVTEGVTAYSTFDAPPMDVQTALDMRVQSLVEVQVKDERRPVVMVGEGGRVGGAGKSAFIGHGHDARSFACPQVRQLWLNTVRWCLSQADA